jgi:hypothetical protein
MDDPRSRNALEAVAFGRVVTPEDRAAATQALQALRDLDERAASPAPAPVTVGVIDDAQKRRDGVWSDAPNRVTETLRRLWVVPVVVASLALGAVGGSFATRVAEPADLAPVAQATVSSDNGTYSGPSDTAIAADPVPGPASDAILASAENMLDQPRIPADTFPAQEQLADFGIDPSTTHFVKVAEDDGTTTLWIARAADGRLCLVLLPYNASFRAACTEQELFAKDGATVIGDEGIDARWDANSVSSYRRSTG